MIKVSVLYPAGDGKTFDMDYCCSSHMPMVQKKTLCKSIASSREQISPGKAGGFRILAAKSGRSGR